MAPDGPEWFDSHCHLQDDFTAEDDGPDAAAPDAGAAAGRLDGVLARAVDAGVTRMVCVGTNAATSAAAVALAGEAALRPGPRAEMWATVGLHPHDASDGVDGVVGVLDAARTGAGAARVVGVGECGLDYHYDHSPRDLQRDAFAAQIALAHHHDLALVIHTREAWDDTFDILASEGTPVRTVFHCFTGGPAEVDRCLDAGARVSFSGIATFRNADDVRAAAARCPSDRILVETDTPFLAPVPHRGTVNEPARVALVGAVLAEVRGEDVDALAATTTANARAVFDV